MLEQNLCRVYFAKIFVLARAISRRLKIERLSSCLSSFKCLAARQVDQLGNRESAPSKSSLPLSSDFVVQTEFETVVQL